VCPVNQSKTYLEPEPGSVQCLIDGTVDILQGWPDCGRLSLWDPIPWAHQHLGGNTTGKDMPFGGLPLRRSG
jgi:hypothetical protein